MGELYGLGTRFQNYYKMNKVRFGTFLAAQRLGLHPSLTGGQGFNPWLGD